MTDPTSCTEKPAIVGNVTLPVETAGDRMWMVMPLCEAEAGDGRKIEVLVAGDTIQLWIDAEEGKTARYVISVRDIIGQVLPLDAKVRELPEGDDDGE